MSLPKPYYQDDWCTIYLGDCRDVMPELGRFDLLLTDPPYGINYRSGHEGMCARGIAGDESVELRDWALNYWLPTPAACFATWRCRPPVRPRGCLIWEKNAGGMGDLTFPWAPTFELVWIYGQGWSGHRGGSILRGSTIPTWNTGNAKRVHPHEKPVDVIMQIARKAPFANTILDPFMGSGTTLVAAKNLNRRAVGIELEERYCEIAALRLSQEVFRFEEPQPREQQEALGI